MDNSETEQDKVEQNESEQKDSGQKNSEPKIQDDSNANKRKDSIEKAAGKVVGAGKRAGSQYVKKYSIMGDRQSNLPVFPYQKWRNTV